MHQSRRGSARSAQQPFRSGAGAPKKSGIFIRALCRMEERQKPHTLQVDDHMEEQRRLFRCSAKETFSFLSKRKVSLSHSVCVIKGEDCFGEKWYHLLNHNYTWKT
jgi:hypothetical protein